MPPCTIVPGEVKGGAKEAPPELMHATKVTTINLQSNAAADTKTTEVEQLVAESSSTASVSEDESWEEKEKTFRTLRTRFEMARTKLRKLRLKAVKKGGKVKLISSSNNHNTSASENAEETLRKRAAEQCTVKSGTKRKRGAIEVCCGSARLTAELNKVGFFAVGIDCKWNKDKPESRNACYDLASESGQKGLEILAKAHDAEYFHFALPCGTVSRAREIPIPASKRRHILGFKAPEPLRSEMHPDGLPTLQGKDLERCTTANLLYEKAVEKIMKVHRLGLSWSVENPANSLLWLTSFFQKLQKELGDELSNVTFHMCMHGGKRDKLVKLWYGNMDLSSLAKKCDKTHTHLPWGLITGEDSIFATSEERKYPYLFCSRLARAVAKSRCVTTDKTVEDSNAHRIFAGKQPRRGMQELIPEFSEERNLENLSLEQTANAKSGLLPLTNAEKGYKLMSVTKRSGVDTGREQFEAKVGINWDEKGFVKEARTLVHPFDRKVTLPPSVSRALQDWAMLGPLKLAEHRNIVIAYYTRRAAELEEDEKELHKGLHPDVQTVIEGKRALLMREWLQDIGYDDLGVVDLLICGIKLVGNLERIGIWQPADKHATIPIEAIWAAAKEKQKAASDDRRSNESDKILWDKTLEEVAGGCLTGPFTAEELTKKHGPLWMPSRRFGVLQNGDVRPIDDFSESLINPAFGTEEKVQMKGVDDIVAAGRAWEEGLDFNKMSYEFKEAGGKVRSGKISRAWSESEARTLSGRVADLKSAYKQLPRHPAHAALSIIAVKDPVSLTNRFFEALAMMFGTTAAVYAFLRFSRAIAAIAACSLSLVVVEFFDDFSQVEPTVTAESAQLAMEEVIKLLGWKLSESEKKRKPFDQEFVSLGVLIDLSQAADGWIVLKNKEGRISNIKDLVQATLQRGQMMFRDALSIRGKIQFAEGQAFGRIAGPLSRVLSMWANLGGPRRLDSGTKELMVNTVAFMETAPPKRIGPRHSAPPVLVFTDGACENEVSIGGVLIDGDTCRYFGAVMKQDVVDSWKTKLEQEQVIGQAELYPLMVARLTFKDWLRGRRVIYFIDNEAARLGLVKAYSPVEPSLKIISMCLQWDYVHESTPWFARVPTCANVADDPSRMMAPCSELLPHAKCMQPIFPEGGGATRCLR